jgi:putative FmdB family regulatory protein
MPLFEYQCRKCRHQFEALVIGARKPSCPKCGSEDLEKRVSPIGFAGVGGQGHRPSGGGCRSTGGG